MAVQLSNGIPPDSDAHVSVSVDTPLGITGATARRKANSQILMHCGQNYVTGEARLVVGGRTQWEVPVEAVHDRKGRLGPVGTLMFDAQTGEFLTAADELEKMKQRCRALLQAASGEG